MKTKTKAWLNLGLLILTLGINFLGGTGRINNLSQGDVSDMYNTLLTPAGFTFSIWSVIYGLLFISLIMMVIRHEVAYFKEVIEAITPLLWVSFIANMIWIVLFSYLQIGLSTLFIFVYLFSLVFILKKLRGLNTQRQWLLPLTFGLNTGWLFIASVVNVSAFLVKIEWNGFGIDDATWGIIMMVVSSILAIVVMLQLRNAAFSLPIAWAFYGIYQSIQTKGLDGTVNVLPLICLVILLGMSVYLFVKNNKGIYPVDNTR